MNTTASDFDILLQKREEALQLQGEDLSVTVKEVLEQCEGIRTLQEVFANTLEETSTTFTRS